MECGRSSSDGGQQRTARVLVVATMTAVIVLGCFLAASFLLVSGPVKTSATSLNQIDRHDQQEDNAQYWYKNSQDILRKHLEYKENKNQAKNILFYLGDGLSLATVTAARIFKGQKEGKPGEESSLFFETFPHTGFSKTYCVDVQVADSACTATAYLGGVKTNYGTLGISAEVKRKTCDNIENEKLVNSLLHWARVAGKSTGIVTTTRITHASPAGTYAHTSERDWESDTDILLDKIDPNSCHKDIARQLVEDFPGREINVIMGGGRSRFLPDNITDDEGISGNRKDHRNLIDRWLSSKKEIGNATYIWNRNQLLSVNEEKTDYLLGLFTPDHMQYHLGADPQSQPTLEEMTRLAIKILSKNEKGFFLFVEGGRIDQAHHANYAQRALDETVEFDAAIRVGEELTSDKDTLTIVTADHSHTMTVNGYPLRGNDILGAAGLSDVDNIAYATLTYANGPGYRKPVDGQPRHDILNDNLGDITYRFPAATPNIKETHGGEDVAVYARGPWSHLFVGAYEQNYIPMAAMYASCLGPHTTLCTKQ